MDLAALESIMRSRKDVIANASAPRLSTREKNVCYNKSMLNRYFSTRPGWFRIAFAYIYKTLDESDDDAKSESVSSDDFDAPITPEVPSIKRNNSSIDSFCSFYSNSSSSHV